MIDNIPKVVYTLYEADGGLYPKAMRPGSF
jgi:hypothetical protein